jgi:hypothetical protein
MLRWRSGSAFYLDVKVEAEGLDDSSADEPISNVKGMIQNLGDNEVPEQRFDLARLNIRPTWCKLPRPDAIPIRKEGADCWRRDLRRWFQAGSKSMARAHFRDHFAPAPAGLFFGGRNRRRYSARPPAGSAPLDRLGRGIRASAAGLAYIRTQAGDCSASGSPSSARAC